MARIERPAPTASDSKWVSDVVAELLRALEVPYVALNPGASFRGLHDSLVNQIGNTEPQMLLCLHEEHAVAIAHGWAKVTERPMVAIVHSNVGLMHATMAVFNAWCDRVPLLLLGATGPVDAAQRRPWIDWIHTARDQAAIVRPYTKWDDQPSSVAATVEALLRAHQIAATAPCGPTYVCLDAGLQEAPIEALPPLPDLRRYRNAPPAAANAELVAAAARRLRAARRPVILAGRVGRSEAAWRTRIALSERLGAPVLTDLKTAAAFPTGHPLHGAPAGTFATPAGLDLLRRADVVLSLDWIDLAGTLKAAGPEGAAAEIIHASVDQVMHNGWSMDHQGLPPVDIRFQTEPDVVAVALLEALQAEGDPGASEWAATGWTKPPAPVDPAVDPAGLATIPTLAHEMTHALAGRPSTLVRGPFSWAGHLWCIDDPLDYLGIDGGAGLGSGPGIVVGAALALRDSGRVPISIFGDGDFMMGCQAIWTAAHYRIPLVVVVANNQSFFNDELHQERMARQRGRLIENKWIGQRIADPDIDIAMLAQAQGAVGIGPVTSANDVAAAFREALAAFDAGRTVVVDVRVEPGYDANTTRLTTRHGLTDAADRRPA